MLLYIYRVWRPGAATFSFSKKKAFDFCIVIENTWKLLSEDLSPKMQYKLKEDVFVSVSSLIYSTIHYLKNSEDRKEVIELLKEKIPLKFDHGLKQKMVSFFLREMPNLYMDIRVLYIKMTNSKLH